MTIDELVAKVKAELPEDWAIHIQVEHGGAPVFLEDPNGDDCEFPGRYAEDVRGVEATVLAALAEAVRGDEDFEDGDEDGAAEGGR